MSTERQAAIWLGIIVLVVILLFALRSVLLPFVAGMAVAYFLDPVVDRLERWGCSRTLATSIVTAAFLLIAVALVLVMLPIMQKQIVDFIERLPDYTAALERNVVAALELLKGSLRPEDWENLRQAANQYVGQAIGWLGGFLKSVWTGGVEIFNLASLILLTPIVSFYLLRDWDMIVENVDRWLPRRHRAVIREQIMLIDERLAGFVRGQGLVCMTLALFYAIALSIAGLEFGLLVGLGAGFVSFIPYVGFILGMIASVGLAIVQFGEIQPVLIVAAIFIAGQVIEGNFLSPKLVGERVGLHPVWVIFALFAGGALLGFVGVILAVPLAAVIGVLSRFALGRYLESPLYSGGTGTKSGGKK